MTIKRGQRISPPTEFKRGNSPHSKLPLGSLLLRPERARQKAFYVIKVADTGCQGKDWKPYAIHIWETNFGVIPDGMFPHHKDGNSLNDSPNNFELVDRKIHIGNHRRELASTNTYGFLRKEREKICPVCTMAFVGRGIWRECCSNECSLEARRRAKRRWEKAHYG